MRTLNVLLAATYLAVVRADVLPNWVQPELALLTDDYHFVNSGKSCEDNLGFSSIYSARGCHFCQER